MANSRYFFFDTVWNDDLNHSQKGFPSVKIGETFTGEGDILYTIPIEQQYRPDLIASKFYGNSKLYWILVYANNFANCPEDFETGVIIRVPKYERVIGLI